MSDMSDMSDADESHVSSASPPPAMSRVDPLSVAPGLRVSHSVSILPVLPPSPPLSPLTHQSLYRSPFRSYQEQATRGGVATLPDGSIAVDRVTAFRLPVPSHTADVEAPLRLYQRRFMMYKRAMEARVEPEHAVSKGAWDKPVTTKIKRRRSVRLTLPKIANATSFSNSAASTFTSTVSNTVNSLNQTQPHPPASSRNVAHNSYLKGGFVFAADGGDLIAKSKALARALDRSFPATTLTPHETVIDADQLVAMSNAPAAPPPRRLFGPGGRGNPPRTMARAARRMQAALLAAKLYNTDTPQSMMPRMRIDASMLQAAAAKTKFSWESAAAAVDDASNESDSTNSSSRPQSNYVQRLVRSRGRASQNVTASIEKELQEINERVAREKELERQNSLQRQSSAENLSLNRQQSLSKQSSTDSIKSDTSSRSGTSQSESVRSRVSDQSKPGALQLLGLGNRIRRQNSLDSMVSIEESRDEGDNWKLERKLSDPFGQIFDIPEHGDQTQHQVFEEQQPGIDVSNTVSLHIDHESETVASDQSNLSPLSVRSALSSAPMSPRFAPRSPAAKRISNTDSVREAAFNLSVQPTVGSDVETDPVVTQDSVNQPTEIVEPEQHVESELPIPPSDVPIEPVVENMHDLVSKAFETAQSEHTGDESMAGQRQHRNVNAVLQRLKNEATSDTKLDNMVSRETAHNQFVLKIFDMRRKFESCIDDLVAREDQINEIYKSRGGIEKHLEYVQNEHKRLWIERDGLAPKAIQQLADLQRQCDEQQQALEQRKQQIIAEVATLHEKIESHKAEISTKKENRDLALEELQIVNKERPSHAVTVAEKIEFATQIKMQQQQAVKTRKKVYEDACRELEKRRSSVQALLRVTQNDIAEIDQSLSETRTTLTDVEVKRQAWQERISGLEEENFKRYGVRAVGAKIDRLIEQQAAAAIADAEARRAGGPSLAVLRSMPVYLTLRSLHSVVDALRNEWQRAFACDICDRPIDEVRSAANVPDKDRDVATEQTSYSRILIPSGHTLCAACYDELGPSNPSEEQKRLKIALVTASMRREKQMKQWRDRVKESKQFGVRYVLNEDEEDNQSFKRQLSVQLDDDEQQTDVVSMKQWLLTAPKTRFNGASALSGRPLGFRFRNPPKRQQASQRHNQSLQPSDMDIDQDEGDDEQQQALIRSESMQAPRLEALREMLALCATDPNVRRWANGGLASPVHSSNMDGVPDSERGFEQLDFNADISELSQHDAHHSDSDSPASTSPAIGPKSDTSPHFSSASLSLRRSPTVLPQSNNSESPILQSLSPKSQNTVQQLRSYLSVWQTEDDDERHERYKAALGGESGLEMFQEDFVPFDLNADSEHEAMLYRPNEDYRSVSPRTVQRFDKLMTEASQQVAAEARKRRLMLQQAQLSLHIDEEDEDASKSPQALAAKLLSPTNHPLKRVQLEKTPVPTFVSPTLLSPPGLSNGVQNASATSLLSRQSLQPASPGKSPSKAQSPSTSVISPRAFKRQTFAERVAADAKQSESPQHSDTIAADSKTSHNLLPQRQQLSILVASPNQPTDMSALTSTSRPMSDDEIRDAAIRVNAAVLKYLQAENANPVQLEMAIDHVIRESVEQEPDTVDAGPRSVKEYSGPLKYIDMYAKQMKQMHLNTARLLNLAPHQLDVRVTRLLASAAKFRSPIAAAAEIEAAALQRARRRAAADEKRRRQEATSELGSWHEPEHIYQKRLQKMDFSKVPLNLVDEDFSALEDEKVELRRRFLDTAVGFKNDMVAHFISRYQLVFPDVPSRFPLIDDALPGVRRFMREKKHPAAFGLYRFIDSKLRVLRDQVHQTSAAFGITAPELMSPVALRGVKTFVDLPSSDFPPPQKLEIEVVDPSRRAANKTSVVVKSGKKWGVAEVDPEKPKKNTVAVKQSREAALALERKLLAQVEAAASQTSHNGQFHANGERIQIWVRVVVSGKARWMLASEAKSLNLEVQDSIKPEAETLQERFERQLRLNSAAASALLPSGNIDSVTIESIAEVAHEESSQPELQVEEEEEDTAAIEQEIEVLETKTQASLRGRAEWRTVELQDDSIYIRRKLPSPPQIARTLSTLVKSDFDLDSFVKELTRQPAPPPLKLVNSDPNVSKLRTPRNARLTPSNRPNNK